MFDINGGEMVVIAIVALIVLGPQRLPELARKAGQWTRTMRAIALDFRQGLEREIGEIENPVRQIREDVVRPIREVENELRGAENELRRAAGDVNRGLRWSGPVTEGGPTSDDAAADLDRINAGEDLREPREQLTLGDIPPGADLLDSGEGPS